MGRFMLMFDSPEEYSRVIEFVTTYFPKLLNKIELYEETEPIFDAFYAEDFPRLQAGYDLLAQSNHHVGRSMNANGPLIR